MNSPAIRTTVVGSYPVPEWLVALPSQQALVDATRVVFKTQEMAGIDVVADGELYRFDINHPDTNGMIEYFVRPMSGIRSEVTRRDAEWAADAINLVLDGCTRAKEKAVHMCFGNYGGQSIQKGTWAKLIGYLNRLHCDHVVLEFAFRGYDELVHFRDQLNPNLALGIGVIDVK